jgi:hypothetical protein
MKTMNVKAEKIFEPYRKNLGDLLLPFEEFRLFCDRREAGAAGLTLLDEYRERAIARGEALLDKQYPMLPLTVYTLYARTGDRARYERLYFERRNDLMDLLLAEAYEGDGRFIHPILDLTWAILEESSWVLPAHVDHCGQNPARMPIPYEGGREYVDLFAAATGADLAWVWYLCREAFDAISPVINRRILENLQDRILNPLLEHTNSQWWMGSEASPWVNNWCPWILSNELNICALTVSDPALRQRVVDVALVGLDRFLGTYNEDGGCDEGPGYWRRAGGALYNASLVLYDMTGGRINVFAHPMMRKMGEFLPKMFICDGRFLNFADAAARIPVNYTWGHDWGELTGSRLMQNFWDYAYSGSDKTALIEPDMPYCGMRCLGSPTPVYRDFCADRNAFFPGLGISVCRDEEDTRKGLYLSLKGGHNSESHNHLDVGNFVVFCDGQPIFIDAGVGSYTARTFGGDRYTIWSMQSGYHNLPTINGVEQKPGIEYQARCAEYDEASGRLTLDLQAAYPAEAGIERYLRSAWIEQGSSEAHRAVVQDELIPAVDGEVVFNLLCNAQPILGEAGKLTIHGRTVCYDPTLALSVDIPDCTWPETASIPASWSSERLYRIRLTAPLKAGEKQVFRIEVVR